MGVAAYCPIPTGFAVSILGWKSSGSGQRPTRHGNHLFADAGKIAPPRAGDHPTAASPPRHATLFQLCPLMRIRMGVSFVLAMSVAVSAVQPSVSAPAGTATWIWRSPLYPPGFTNRPRNSGSAPPQRSAKACARPAAASPRPASAAPAASAARPGRAFEGKGLRSRRAGTRQDR